MAFAVVFFVIGILMFVFTKDFAYNGLMDFGAGFWPRIIAVIMMVCAVLLFITSLLSKDPKMNEVVIDWKSAGMKRVYKVCGVMILFCVILYLFACALRWRSCFAALCWQCTREDGGCLPFSQ